MKELLFENPLPLYVALGVAELVIVGLWYRARTRRLAVALAVPVVLAFVLAATAALVETDREKLQRVLVAIAAHVEKGDFDSVRPHLAEDFHGEYLSRDAALEAGRNAWREFGVRKTSISGVRVHMDESLPKAEFRTHIGYNFPGLGQGTQAIDWTVYWGRRDGQWKIVRVEKPRLAPPLGG